MTDASAPERVFLFTFNEHEHFDDVEDADEAARVLLQHARRQGWEAVSRPPALLEECREQPEELRASLESALLGEDLPAEAQAVLREAIRVPFDKLAAKIAAEGWTFAGGQLWEFEGNHNDTEIYVVLRRPG